MVSACASSTSWSFRYTKGLSSVPAPCSSTPKSRTAASICSVLIWPPLRVRVFQFILPAAWVRLMIRPAPCTVL
ncbi:hypothetical protein D1872_343520 [compost metagenome]